MDNHYLMCNNGGELDDGTVTETIDESMAE